MCVSTNTYLMSNSKCSMKAVVLDDSTASLRRADCSNIRHAEGVAGMVATKILDKGNTVSTSYQRIQNSKTLINWSFVHKLPVNSAGGKTSWVCTELTYNYKIYFSGNTQNLASALNTTISIHIISTLKLQIYDSRVKGHEVPSGLLFPPNL